MLLEPGAERSDGITDERSVLQAMLDVESAWVRVQHRLGLVDDGAVAAMTTAAEADRHDLAQIARAAEDGGNPVVPMLASLRESLHAQRTADARDVVHSVGEGAAGDVVAAVHRGLTSQDVVDTALMCIGTRALDALGASLASGADALARLAHEHRRTVRVARTLGQPALPTTFGLTAADWLNALDDVRDELAGTRASLPVQCGGAAGTLAAIETLAPGRSLEAADLLAEELGLASRGRPWHTDRGPVTRLGDVIVRTADTMGRIAADIVLSSRLEIGELREPLAQGRGGSSTLPQKRNPVLSVLIRSAAIEAPHLGAVLHSAAGLAVDERPDGAWHAEWGTLLRLVRRVVVAAAQLEEVLSGLVVDAEAMRRHVDAVGPALVSERVLTEVAGLPNGAAAVAALRPALQGRARARHLIPLLRAYLPEAVLSDADIEDLLDPLQYLGATEGLIDRALARHDARHDASLHPDPSQR